MSNIPFSKIDEAAKLAARLAQLSAAVERAMLKRDNALYEYLGSVYLLNELLQEIGEPEAMKALKAKYGAKLPVARTSVTLLLELTYPNLCVKKRSKYAGVLRYVREKKKGLQSVKSFVRANGSINGCVAKEKKLREKKARNTW
jgi:hypothetical protein